MLRGPANTPLAPALAVGLAGAAFLAWSLAGVGFDPSHLVRAGEVFSDPALVPRGLAVERGATGYDGQFYYRMALDPLATGRTAHGITFDLPALRYGRILYPLIAWAASAGQPGLVPHALVLVNLAGLMAVGWLAGMYAQRLGAHALWGALVAFYPGLLITLSRDLTEIVELALLLGGLLLLRAGRAPAAAALLALAVLARETAVVVAGAVLLVEALRTARDRTELPRLLVLAIPVAVFAVWQSALLLLWGETPVGAGSGNIGAPLLGLIAALRTGPVRTEHTMLWYAFLLFAAASALIVALQLRTSVARREGQLWLISSVLAISLAEKIWLVSATSLRALTEVSALGALVVIGSTPFARAALLLLTLTFWSVVALLRGGFD